MLQKKATALFVYNSDDKYEEQKYDPKQKADAIPIPIIYVSNAVSKKYFNDETAELALKFNVEFEEKKERRIMSSGSLTIMPLLRLS